MEALETRSAIVFKTTYRCPRCGSRLVFIEDADNVWLGCDRCAQYVKLNKREVRRYWNYASRVMSWRDLLQDLYKSYEESA